MSIDMEKNDAEIRRQTGLSASRWLFLLCFLVYSVSYIARGSFSFARATMVSDGAIGVGIAGAVSAAYFICYAVGQLVNGFLADRLSPFAIVTAGLSVVVLSSFAMSISQPDWLYVLWWGIGGYGHSMLWSPVFFIISNVINTKMRVFSLTAISICAPVGKIASALVSSLALSGGIWQNAFYAASGIALAVLVLWIARFLTLKKRIVPRAAEAQPSDMKNSEVPAKRRGLIALLAASGVIIMLPAMLVHGLFYNGVVELIPTILSDEYSLSASMAALIEIIIPILSIAGVFLANFVYFKIFKQNDMRSAAFLMGMTLLPIAIMLLLAFFKRNGYMIGQYADAVIFVTTYALIYLLQFAFNHVAIVLMPAKFARYSCSSTLSGIANAINYGGSAVSTYGMTYALLKLPLWQTVLIWAGFLIVASVLVSLAQRRWTGFAKRELDENQDSSLAQTLE